MQVLTDAISSNSLDFLQLYAAFQNFLVADNQSFRHNSTIFLALPVHWQIACDTYQYMICEAVFLMVHVQFIFAVYICSLYMYISI